MKAYKMVVAASIAGLLGGCTTPTLNAEQQARLAAADKIQAADRQVQQKIAESTQSNSRILQLIDRIERGGPGSDQGQAASQPTQADADREVAEAKDLLAARLRIDWRNGQADELLAKLAKQMGIPFKVVGARRPIAPVTVVSSNDSMGAILASVGKQVDRSADVVLNKTQKPAVLELRFK